MNRSKPSLSASRPPEGIESRRIDLLYRSAAVGLPVAPVLALVCTWLLWPQVAHPWLLAWVGAVLLVSVARYGLGRLYEYRTDGAGASARWEAWFVVGAVLHGIAWGALAPLAAVASYPLQVFAAFAIGGMVIAAIGLLGASRKAFVGFAVPSLGTQFVVLAVRPEEQYLAMGALIAIFALVLARILHDYHRALVQNIERDIVNERLLAEQRELFDAATAQGRALRESEERLDLVVRASQGGIWDWDIAANVSYLSPRFKGILRYPADADFGAAFRFKEHLHPDDAERVLAMWYRAIANPRTPFDCELRMRCMDGHYAWIHARGIMLCDETGAATRSVGSIMDISDRKQVEERLRDSERHFRYLVETSNDLVWVVDGEGRWSYLSPRATRQIFGCEPEDLLGRRLVDTQPESERPRTEAMLARVLADGTASHFETAHVNRNGEAVVLSLNATPMRDDSGRIVGVTGTATDISPLKRREVELSTALEDQHLIFESVAEGIVMMRDGVVNKCNRRFSEMLGYAPEELVGRPSVLWYADPSEWDAAVSLPHAVREQDGSLHTELRVKRRDGSVFWCDARGRMLNPDRPEEGSLWIYIDISARKERESRIQHLADHDALTGLLNRRMFEDRLRQALANARRASTVVALMLVDLDGFKAINDSYGHLTGDYVLRTVAKRIQESVRETDTVARLGGDEFVVVLVGQRSTEDSALVAEKMLAAITQPIPAGGRQLQVGASIGISIFPRDGDSPEALLRDADAAMYRVKDAGKNRYQFFSD